jgi:SHS2 domain-containing protein
MAMEKNAGYREIEHTADWELHVWAPNLEVLLQTAAQGMYALSQTETADTLVERNFTISYHDRESLLVDFLSELLFFGEDEGLALNQYQLDFSGSTLNVQASGAPIKAQAKEIKAVTYHCMQIHSTERGLEVNIVFDV